MSSSIYALLLLLIITATVLVIPFTSTTCLVLGHADVQESKKGFQLQLIHRDYGMNLNKNELLRRAIQRGKNRLQWLHATMMPTTNAVHVSAPTAAGSGENVVFYSIGGQACKFIMDTGSDLIWTQCQPCIKCYNQSPNAIYNPKLSSTYANLSCINSYCLDLPNFSCGTEANCLYLYQYGDGSSTSGTLCTETLTLGKPGNTVSFPNIVFGCGTNNQGTFADACGLIGLGRGPLSFTSQLAYLIFSYCLVPLGSTANSTMYFGSSAAVKGQNATSTMLRNSNYPSFYYITITGIKYGGTAIPVQSTDFGFSNSTGYGGCILDSGTTLTYWPADIVALINVEMKAQLSKQKLIPLIGKSDLGLSPCWFKPSNASFQYPQMEITFNKGQTLNLSAANYMIADTYSFFFIFKFQVVCSILQPNSPGNPSIYGNIMQANHLVVYDLGQGTVKFIKTICGQLS